MSKLNDLREEISGIPKEDCQYNHDDVDKVLDKIELVFKECDSLTSDVERLEKERDMYKAGLQALFNKVNRVTSAHRHKQPVKKKDLDDLSNRQLEVEELIKDNKFKEALDGEGCICSTSSEGIDGTKKDCPIHGTNQT